MADLSLAPVRTAATRAGDRMRPVQTAAAERLGPAKTAAGERLGPAKTAAGERLRPAKTAARERLAPVQTMVTRVRDRLRPRGGKRSAVGAWWHKIKVALRLERPQRRVAGVPVPRIGRDSLPEVHPSEASVPQKAVVAAGGAGAICLVVWRVRASRKASPAAEPTNGAIREVHPPETAPDNDRTLADKVSTEIFRREDAPKGSVNVSAVDGIVYLRGEVPTAEEIGRLVNDTLSVTGVLRVENMLHTPGTATPTDGAG